jgi:hypothetical protein
VSQLKLALLVALLVPLGACVALALYHWSRAARHLAPGAKAWVPLANWTRDDPEHYTPEGRHHLAASLRYRWAAVALGIAAVLVNTQLR